jgi:hypothetical protein
VARQADSKAITMVIHLDIASDGNGGTRVAAAWGVRSKGFVRVLEPVVRRAFAKQLDLREAQIQRGLAKGVPVRDD